LLNLYAAWIGILLGLISGAILGMFFHQEDWLGGYGSWRRRMLRLGHISFFGLGLINLSYALTFRTLEMVAPKPASILLIVGAIGMPAVCLLSAVRESFRRLFFIPVVSIIAATAIVVERIFSL
jgi:hypothetical protein